MVCLQELKAPQEKFPQAALAKLGYGAIWQGQKSWNGVAILARDADPIETRRGLPGDPDDTHSRYIEAAVRGIVGRMPLSAKRQSRPRTEIRLQTALVRKADCSRDATCCRMNAPVALAGDYNVMPTELDVYKPERWVDDALFRPEVRKRFHRLIEQGWTDAVAHAASRGRIYTFWDYFRNAWGRDAGLRIDHLLLTPLWPNASSLPVSTARCGAGRRPAIMLPSGSKVRVKTRAANKMTQPLLVIDGDSFAHRAYHAVPKTIRSAGNKGAGAIVGFANFLLRLFEGEQPRAVLVGWDTLDAPTYRHKALEGYQAGRQFDDELIDQLDLLPEFVTACGFASAKAAGYEADDFLAAAVARRSRKAGP